MPHLPPAHHETSKHDSLNETKIKEKQNETIPDSNSNLTKSMTHHNQTNERTTWILRSARRELTWGVERGEGGTGEESMLGCPFIRSKGERGGGAAAVVRHNGDEGGCFRRGSDGE
jgi:hypothetical protein